MRKHPSHFREGSERVSDDDGEPNSSAQEYYTAGNTPMGTYTTPQ